jgi:hypothetical protein
MPYSNKSKFDLPSDAPAYMIDLMNQLRNELKRISAAMSSSNGSTVVIAGVGGNGTTVSTGSTDTGGVITPSSDTVRSGVYSVTAGTDAYIPFPNIFTSAPTVVFCAVAGEDGSFGLINTLNLTTTIAGFTIPGEDILQDGNVFYIAHGV